MSGSINQDVILQAIKELSSLVKENQNELKDLQSTVNRNHKEVMERIDSVEENLSEKIRKVLSNELLETKADVLRLQQAR